MILDETINKFIRDYINSVLGIPDFAIRAYQDGPRPIGAYATVNVLSDNNLGLEQSTLTNNPFDDDMTATIEGMRQILVSLNFFRDDLAYSAMDAARFVRTSLWRESSASMFREAGLGLTTRSEVRHIQENLENGWENRAQFDINLSAVGTDAELIRSILTIEIDGAVNYATDRTLTLTLTQEIGD